MKEDLEQIVVDIVLLLRKVHCYILLVLASQSDILHDSKSVL